MVDTINAISASPTSVSSTQSQVPQSRPVEAAPRFDANVSAPELDNRTVVDRPAIKPFSDSGLTTYRDQDSGRVIIRVFDRETGDVLVELPPDTQRSALRPPKPPPPPLGTSTEIDV